MQLPGLGVIRIVHQYFIDGQQRFLVPLRAQQLLRGSKARIGGCVFCDFGLGFGSCCVGQCACRQDNQDESCRYRPPRRDAGEARDSADAAFELGEAFADADHHR